MDQHFDSFLDFPWSSSFEQFSQDDPPAGEEFPEGLMLPDIHMMDYLADGPMSFELPDILVQNAATNADHGLPTDAPIAGLGSMAPQGSPQGSPSGNLEVPGPSERDSCGQTTHPIAEATGSTHAAITRDERTATRRKKAPTISEAQWEPIKDKFTSLYVVQGLTLEKAMEEIKKDLGFVANKRQYLERIRKWKIRKNTDKEERQTILNGAQVRNLGLFDNIEALLGLVSPAGLIRPPRRPPGTSPPLWEATIRREISDREVRLGNDHPETLGHMEELLKVLFQHKRFKAAEEPALELLIRRAKSPASSRMNLSFACYALGFAQSKPDEDGTLVTPSRLLDLGTDVLGLTPCEPKEFVEALEQCAREYAAKSKWHKAERLSKEALELSTDALGEGDPLTLAQSLLLASIYLEQDRVQEARMSQEAALEVSTRVLGPLHSGTLRHMLVLASCYDREGCREEVEKMYSQALHLPAEEPADIEVLEMAARFAFRAVALLERFRQGEDPSFDTSTFYVNGVYFPCHLHDQGGKRDRVLALHCTTFAECMKNIDSLARNTNDEGLVDKWVQITEPYWDAFTALLDRASGPESVQIMGCMDRRAAHCVLHGRYLEGEKLARRVIEASEAVLPPGDSKIRARVSFLRFVLSVQGLTQELATLKEKLDEMGPVEGDDLGSEPDWEALMEERGYRCMS